LCWTCALQRCFDTISGTQLFFELLGLRQSASSIYSLFSAICFFYCVLIFCRQHIKFPSLRLAYATLRSSNWSNLCVGLVHCKGVLILFELLGAEMVCIFNLLFVQCNLFLLLCRNLLQAAYQVSKFKIGVCYVEIKSLEQLLHWPCALQKCFDTLSQHMPPSLVTSVATSPFIQR